MKKLLAVLLLGLSSSVFADGSVTVVSSFAETNVRQTMNSYNGSGLYGGDWVTYWGLQRQVYGHPTKFIPADPIDVAWDEEPVMEGPDEQEPVAELPPLPQVLEPVFIFDKTDLAQPWDGAQPLAAYMDENPQASLLVIGHADQCGQEAYNAELGQKRAMKVRGLIIEKGISPDRLVVSSQGEDMPNYFRNTEKSGDCRSLGNRRTEFVAVNSDGRISNLPTDVTAELK